MPTPPQTAQRLEALEQRMNKYDILIAKIEGLLEHHQERANKVDLVLEKIGDLQSSATDAITRLQVGNESTWRWVSFALSAIMLIGGVLLGHYLLR